MSAIRTSSLRQRLLLTLVVLGFLVLSGPAGTAARPASSARLQRVEQIAFEMPGKPGEAPVRMSLAELMKTFNVPGLSVAVIENYKITDVKAYGVIAPGSSTPVTTKTLF